MNANQFKNLSLVCLVLGFVSIVGSIVIWYLTGGKSVEAQAHGERFGIFVGLWAPTFMILSNRFDRYSESKNDKSN
jgi:Zn-dependent protease with chaperone function